MIPSNIELMIKPSVEEAAHACALRMAAELAGALSSKDRVMLAISGGNSPRPMFNILAAQPLDWQRVHVFWVDERHVPPDDAASNYGMAQRELIVPAGIPAGNVHRVPTELAPRDAASAYSQDIVRICGDNPQFDLVQRGIGPDAHTASLFPGDPLILQKDGLVAASWVPKLNQWRITMTPAILAAARATVVYEPGADKAEATAQILEGPYRPLDFPAQIFSRQGVAETWFLDAPAVAALTAPGS
jgi:6-phosphogluconolactonase